MKKHLTKYILAIVICVLSFTILSTGCSLFVSGPKESNDTDILEFQFFRNYSWDVGKYPFDETNKISKWIIDNKKVKVNFTWPGGGNANDKLNIMTATNALPEVIMVARDVTWMNLISKDGKSDKVIALDEYFNKYTGYRENVAKECVDFTRVNNKIYGILNWPTKGSWLGYGTGIVINTEIYKSIGSPKLDTMEDLYNYLKAVKEKDSTIIPLQPGSSEVTFGLLWCGFGDGRTPEDSYGLMRRPINGKLVHVINDPKFPEFIKYLRKLYSEGLISQEYSIETPEPIMDKMKKRKVAVFCGFDSINVADSARSILEAAGKANPYEAYPIPAAAGVDRKTIVSGGGGMIGWNVICLTNNAKNKDGKLVPGREEAIYKYLDWVFSNEGQRVMLCGPEGELWQGLDSDNFPIFKPGKSLNLTAAETNVLPIGQFMYPGDKNYVDSLKNKIYAAMQPSQREWRVNQQLKFANQLKATDEYTGIDIISDNNISQIYVRADDYWKSKMVAFVTESGDVDVMISEAKSELYTVYNFGEYEEYANNVWKENRTKLKLK